MGYDSIRYLFLLFWVQLECFRNLMDFLFASILNIRVQVQNRSYIKFFFTAWILIVGSERSIQAHFDTWWFCVHMTVSQFWNMKVVGTALTFEYVKVGPNLPIDFSPRYSVGLSDKCNEFLKIPCTINNMLCSNLSVIINIRLSLRTMKYFSLTHSKKLIAVSTFI